VPPPELEMKNRLAELLNEDDEDGDQPAAGDDTGNHQAAANDERTTSVVEAEVYAAVDHDAEDLPLPPPPDCDDPDIVVDQVQTVAYRSVVKLVRAGVRVSQVKPSHCFGRLEKLVLPSTFDTNLSSFVM